MNYIVIVKGDWNDADYIIRTIVVDFNESPFKNWEGFEEVPISYKAFFEAFGEVLKEFDLLNSKNYNVHNWDEDTRSIIVKNISDKLNITDLLEHPDELLDLLYDFVPGNWEQPLHTIKSIKAIPTENEVKFY